MQENDIKDIEVDKTDFLKRLRTHTQPPHTELEQHPISASLFKPDMNQADYTRYLQIMLGVMSGFERDCYPVLASMIEDIDQRRKSPWLMQDLTALNHSVPVTPVALNASALSPHYLLGRMYVLEGSTLGGAVIYRQLQPVLHFTPEHGGRYFYGYGPETGKMWKRFTEILSTEAVEKNGESEILKGAIDQFVAMKTYFDQQLSLFVAHDCPQYR